MFVTITGYLRSQEMFAAMWSDVSIVDFSLKVGDRYLKFLFRGWRIVYGDSPRLWLRRTVFDLVDVKDARSPSFFGVCGNSNLLTSARVLPSASCFSQCSWNDGKYLLMT